MKHELLTVNALTAADYCIIPVQSHFLASEGTESLSIQYGTNGMPDYGANQMYQSAVNAGADHGSMSAMPEIVGLAVWKEGHIGVYIGGGYVIEAASTTKGVIKTQVEGRGWQGWCKIPYIDYLEEE